MTRWPSLTQEQVTQALVGFIQRRYAQTAELPLPDTSHPSHRFMAVERRLLAFCLAYREQVLDAIRHDQSLPLRGPLTMAMLRATRAYITHRNQFVVLTKGDWVRMEQLYNAFLKSMAAALELAPSGDKAASRIERLYALALRNHYLGLQRFFGELDSRDMLEREALCAEYSPETQLAVLGLDPAALREPILDVGCGASAGLVVHLRALGLEAYGLDRDAPDGPHTARGNWIRYDYGQRRWGAILSHMAFSTHLIHQHLNAQGRPEPHARALMRMLDALAPDGMLAYSPGLPFIEPLLGKHGWWVEPHPLPEPLGSHGRLLRRYARLLGDDPLYAAHVRAEQ